MKGHISNPNRYAKWKYLVVIFAVALMAISALPNWYGESATVHIRSNGQAISAIEPAQINTALSQQNIEAQQISTNNKEITVYLTAERQQQGARTALKNALGNDYNISLSMESNAPAWLDNLGLEPIKLGLDLRGGVRFLLKVDTQVALKEHIKQIQSQSKSFIRSNKVYGATAVIAQNNQVHLTFPEQKFEDMAPVKRALKQQYPELTFKSESQSRYIIEVGEKAITAFETEVMQQNLHTLRDRIEELGITEAVTQRKGKDYIRIELPGVQDPAEAKRIIGATAALDFHEVKSTGGKAFKTEDGRTMYLDPRPLLSGKHIKDARAAMGEMGAPEVRLVLDDIGGKTMLKHSKKNVGNLMVTVFTDYSQNAKGQAVKAAKIINAATITSVLGDRFSITNMQSSQAAQELALLLRAGSLTAPVTIEAESTIGPSLGQDNIDNGMAALALGIGMILLFMALWYRRLGFVANTALVLNLICLMGLMSLLPGAVLTLPGIAGLVLTVGMAVDTNVLIFERIKEESKKGRSLPMAVEYGYNNAFATILDANITTMITAMILYGVGYGPIKGFAITLGLGILTSMFTGVFASRAIVNLMLIKSSNLLKGVTQ